MPTGQTIITINYNRAWVDQALTKVYGYTWLFDWGMYLFLIATLGIAIWIFFDSTTKNKADRSLVPRILSKVGVFLVAPAFIFRFTGTADGITKLVKLNAELGTPVYEGAIPFNVKWLVAGYGPTIALVALLGVVVSVVALIIYSSTVSAGRYSGTMIMGKLNDLERKQQSSQKPSTIGTGVPTAPSQGKSASATIIDQKPAAATIIDRGSGASLKAVSGADDGRVWNLPAHDVKLGRDKANPVDLSDGKSSREHAKLMYRAGSWSVIDLGSSNGTYHNGEQVVKEQALADGDSLRIGDTTLVFSLSA